MTQTRELRQIINGDRVSDGAGVQLTRIIGSPQLNMLDPFLMFDAFGSDKPQDYIAGFPPHRRHRPGGQPDTGRRTSGHAGN